MYSDKFLKVMITIMVCLLVVVTIGKTMLVSPEVEIERKTNEVTTAKPIYQQQIGDDTEPDILIIYEAEVDGVKVYPSVIKEAK